MAWSNITPNNAGDWLNQRSDSFEGFDLIGDKDKKLSGKQIIFSIYSGGALTSRDVWCYNSSYKYLNNNINNFIQFYNDQRSLFSNELLNNSTLNASDFIDYDKTKISWSRSLINSLINDKTIEYNNSNVFKSVYRPFFKQYLYFDKFLNEMRYQLPKLFPTSNHPNLVICVSGIGGTKLSSALICNCIPDLNILDASTQCFPLYYYEHSDEKQQTIFSEVIDGYVRHDAITDYIFVKCRAKYGQQVTKNQIFYYVYGLLHSKDYRETFAADLKKSLPRIPLVESPLDFTSFYKAGEALADLHLNYESVKPYAGVKVTGLEKGNFIVDKMRYGKLADETKSKLLEDKSTIHYNNSITITGIPLEAYEYVVNGRSALDWLVEKYRVTVDKDSGIINDPNDWAKEHNEPRYILDLILRIITVSLETIKIVNHLPRLIF
jgi:predicted helicase